MKITFSNHKRMYRDKFADDDGKRILHELMERFYVLSSTKRKGDTTEDILIKEGMRNVVLYILSQANYDIDNYLNNREKYKMEIEHD